MSNNSQSNTMNEVQINGHSVSLSLSQTGFATDSAQPRTLYVGNLDPTINEDFIRTLFGRFGTITGLKFISDNVSDPYCFVEYEDHVSASNAIMTMNKRVCLEREIKVNWAIGPNHAGPKQDTSKHFHVFVGDLSHDIESQQLRDAFAVFGEISECRVVRDSHSLRSKGYGFVSFVKKQDAECAIANMNGQWIGGRAIRTNWASRRPPREMRAGGSGVGGGSGGGGNGSNNFEGQTSVGPSRQLNFDEVFAQSSPNNCTVYCGGITTGLTEELIYRSFGYFGMIHEVRIFKDKGYAFIKFTTKEAATNAIVSMHNQEILGQTVKCSWGRESDSSSFIAQTPLAPGGISSPQMMYGGGPQYGQQMPYWYPQPYPSAAMPPGQPTYAVQGGLQYPSFSPPGYYGPATGQTNQPSVAFGMATIGAAYHPNNSSSYANAHLPDPMNHTSSFNSTMPPPMVGAYPMQGYQ